MTAPALARHRQWSGATPPAAARAAALDGDIEALVEQCYADPLRYVQTMWPWREPGPLEGYDGPDAWQTALLTDIGAAVRARKFDGRTPVLPLRFAVASAYGVGKTALAAWLVHWIFDTRPDSKGTVTANTFTQLEDKTWAAVQYWARLKLTAHWCTVTASLLYEPSAREAWKCSPQSCREENSEAFAGQHNISSTSYYIFDEGSAVPDEIYNVAEGGLTDGEPMIFIFGNPTRRSGKLYRTVWGSDRDRWNHRIIDGRTVARTNKALYQEWIDDYGEDSDFVRVHVKGLPPTADEAQYIDSTRIFAAQKRVVSPLPDEPLIAGVDVPDRGPSWFVCRFRRGADARTLPPIRIPGSSDPDFRSKLIAVLAERLRETAPDRKVAAMFIDSAFGSPIVERLHALGFTQVHEVRFGAVETPDRLVANMRAYMWKRLKEWLPTGAIPADDHRLESDLQAPGFHLNTKDCLVLESKESMRQRSVASPDDGDALALTWALPVALPAAAAVTPYRPVSAWG